MEIDKQLLEQFLKKNNINSYKVTKVAGDASFRSYWRINDEKESKILMFAPPNLERMDHFIKIDQILEQHSFRSPKIFAQDQQNGFLLLEDFGNNTLAKHLSQNPKDELGLYKKACDTIIKIAKTPFELNNYDLTTYNNFLLTREVMLFIDWYLPHIKKHLSLKEISLYKSLWIDAFDSIALKSPILVLRDYHSENLMVIDKDQEMGLLDFQDAVIGHSAYDLVSLLEDARRDVAPEVVNQCYDYFTKESNVNLEKFNQEYQILSLQRNLKILGIFARLANRDNKPSYLNLLPRVIKLVENRIRQILNDKQKPETYLVRLCNMVSEMINL